MLLLKYFNLTISPLKLAIDGYEDKQKVLLKKILTKITDFKIDPQRFTVLKELVCCNAVHSCIRQLTLY